MENKISKKDAKTLIKRAKAAIKVEPFLTPDMRQWRLDLVAHVDPGNCPMADQEMLRCIADGI